MRRLSPVLILLFLIVTIAGASDNSREVGPKVGEKLPDFRLQDQYGVEHSLKELMGKKGAIIDFYRSADW